MGKIAVIDSGVGGLTVVKEVLKQLPYEDIIYYGDQKNCPYGDKTVAEIKSFVLDVVCFISKFDIKALIVACNTATSVVLNDLKNLCPYPVIGVIEPGAQFALEQTKNKKIGIIATEKTVASKVYENTLTWFDSSVEVYAQACPKIVPLIESGTTEIEEIHSVLQEYLYGFRELEIDTLILGCTHYPLLEKNIRNILGESVKLANPAIRTVTKLKEVLYNNHTYKHTEEIGDVLYYTSGKVKEFDELASNIIGKKISSVRHVDFGEMKGNQEIATKMVE